MAKDNDTNLTEKNLDRLAEFLTRQQENADLVDQIPDGAHIFQGAYDDSELTQENVNLASKIALGMALGYVEEAPLIMLFENEQRKQVVLDLSTIIFHGQSQQVIETYQKRSRKKVASRLHLSVS
jgi:hypothetical protein